MFSFFLELLSTNCKNQEMWDERHHSAGGLVEGGPGWHECKWFKCPLEYDALSVNEIIFYFTIII